MAADEQSGFCRQSTFSWSAFCHVCVIGHWAYHSLVAWSDLHPQYLSYSTVCVYRRLHARRLHAGSSVSLSLTKLALKLDLNEVRLTKNYVGLKDSFKNLMCFIYKSLFTENSVATQKRSSAIINTNKIQYKIQRSSPSQ